MFLFHSLHLLPITSRPAARAAMYSFWPVNASKRLKAGRRNESTILLLRPAPHLLPLPLPPTGSSRLRIWTNPLKCEAIPAARSALSNSTRRAAVSTTNRSSGRPVKRPSAARSRKKIPVAKTVEENFSAPTAELLSILRRPYRRMPARWPPSKRS